MATAAELLTGYPLATIESLATTGNQIAPRVTASPAPTGEGLLPVPPSIPTVNQGGVDVPISGDQLRKWQEYMRVKGAQGEASAPLSPADPAPSSPVDPSSKIPQDMQSRIAELNEVFARPKWVQNGRLEAGESVESIEADFGAGSVADAGLVGDWDFTPQIDKLGDQPVNFNVQPAPAVQSAAEFVAPQVEAAPSVAPQDVVGYGTMQNADGTFTAMLPYGGNVKGFATEEAALAAIDESYASKGIGGRAEADQLMAQDEVNPMPGLQSFVGNDDGTASKDVQVLREPEPGAPVEITPEIANAITRFSQAKYLGEQDEARAASGQALDALSKDPVELRTQARDQQASYEAFKASGKTMTQAQSDQAYKNAQARGTTWDPEVGYGDAPQVVIDNMKANLSKAINTSFKGGWIFDADGREEVDSMMEIVENYPRDGRKDQVAINSLRVLMGKLYEMEDVPAYVKAQIGTILSAVLSSDLPTNPRPIVKVQNESAANAAEPAAQAVESDNPTLDAFLKDREDRQAAREIEAASGRAYSRENPLTDSAATGVQGIQSFF